MINRTREFEDRHNTDCKTTKGYFGSMDDTCGYCFDKYNCEQDYFYLKGDHDPDCGAGDGKIDPECYKCQRDYEDEERYHFAMFSKERRYQHNDPTCCAHWNGKDTRPLFCGECNGKTN